MSLRQFGFSLVEIIVVVTAIGILAAIMIVSYNGVQNRAYDAAVQSDLESFSALLEEYRAYDSSNSSREYPRTTAVLSTLGIKASKNSYNTSVALNFIYCLANSGTNAYKDYRLVALSKSGKIFVTTQDGFISHSLTASSLTSTLCTTTFSMSLVANGQSSPNTWQAWVGSS
jgi:prepilin-type N-terminal cleavage/methylation domain-containing protein